MKDLPSSKPVQQTRARRRGRGSKTDADMPGPSSETGATASDTSSYVKQHLRNSRGKRPADPEDHPREDLLKPLFDSLEKTGCQWVMWNDNYEDKFTNRDPEVITAGIKEVVESMGGLDACISALGGENPYVVGPPVCGVSAQNMFKLLTEKDAAVDPTKETFHDTLGLRAHIEQLNPQKHYALMINDERLGHIYLVDVPAMQGGQRQAYIIQSDMGAGILPSLKIEDWMQKRGYDSVSINSLVKLNSPELLGMDEAAWRQLLASVLDIDGRVNNLDSDKQLSQEAKGRNGRPARSMFASREYDRAVARRNIDYVLGFSAWSPSK